MNGGRHCFNDYGMLALVGVLPNPWEPYGTTYPAGGLLPIMVFASPAAWLRSAFRHVLGTDPRVSEYQVTQTAAGADILVIGAPAVEALRAALVTALRRYGLSEPAVQIRSVERLQRHQASGKLRRFIPLQTRSAP